MTSVVTVTQENQNLKIYDNFYETQLIINAGDWDVVYSYFKATSDNAQIANNFASLLFKIAQEGNYNVLDLLATIKGTDTKLQMNQVICYYLNSFRLRVALYGIGIVPKPNESVQRNIVM